MCLTNKTAKIYTAQHLKLQNIHIILTIVYNYRYSFLLYLVFISYHSVLLKNDAKIIYFHKIE